MGAELQGLREQIEKELKGEISDVRASRLHYELATLLEHRLDDPSGAAEQYKKALERSPDHRPALRGARRMLLTLKRPRDTLPLFDAEVRLTKSPKRRARILAAKGALYEHILEMLPEAREAYQAAYELDGQDMAILNALERCDRTREAWQRLLTTRERLSNLVEDDQALRAAFITNHAQLVEIRQKDSDKAASLHQAALSLDPAAPAALSSLKRLFHSSGRRKELIDAHRREIGLSHGARARVMSHRCIARLTKQNGDIGEAITAMESAAAEAHHDVFLLEELVDLYKKAKRSDALAQAQERLFDALEDEGQRVATAYSLGHLYEVTLDNRESAAKWYEASLDLDPCFRPAFDALSALYEQRGEWSMLIERLSRFITSADEAGDRAASHARIAELYEKHLTSPDEAAVHYNKALGHDPDHLHSYKSLARLHSQAGRWRELVELHQRYVDREPSLDRIIATLFRIGAIYEDRLNDGAGAIHAYQQILELSPDHLGAIQASQRVAEGLGDSDLFLAMIEHEVKLESKRETKIALLCRAADVCDTLLGDQEGAIQRYLRVLNLDAEQEEAKKSLGRIYRKAGRWEDLLKSIQSQIQHASFGPSRALLVHEMGEICETHLGRKKEAIAHYNQALSIQATHRPSYNALRRLLDSPKTQKDLTKLLEKRLETLESPDEIGELAAEIARRYEEELGDPASALTFNTRALEAVPDLLPAMEGRTRLLYAAQQWSSLADALKAEAAATSEETRAINAKLEEGLVRANRLGDQESAVECAEWVLKQRPDHRGALMMLEELHRAARDEEALANIYRQQAEVYTNPSAKISALRELSRIQLNQGLLNDSELTRASILELKHDDEESLEELARLAEIRGDHPRAIQALSRLVSTNDDREINAWHMMQIAELIEGQDATQALGAYRAALALDPEGLVVTRGFTRAARRSKDPNAIVEAATREAKTTQDMVTAVTLLREAVGLRLQQNDLEGASSDLEKALELDPRHRAVAESFHSVMIRLGKTSRLVEILTRAADLIESRERKAELHLVVAEVQSTYRHNLPAAIAASQRALESLPHHLPTLIRLARDLEDNEQWREAVEILGKVVKLSKDDAVVIEAHLRIAAIIEDRLGTPRRAEPNLLRVISIDKKNRSALSRLSRLELGRGNYSAAIDYARKLLELAENNDERAASLNQIANIEGGQKHHEAAATALEEAISFEGAQGSSSQAYQQMLHDQTPSASWVSYLAALMKYLERPRSTDKPIGATWNAAALVLAENLGRPADAISTLRQGLEEEPNDITIRLQLARLLRKMGAPEQSIDELQHVFQSSVVETAAWREYVLAHKALGNEREASVAAQALNLLKAATAEEMVVNLGYQPRAITNLGELFNSPGFDMLTSDPSFKPITELVSALSPAFAKLYPADPGSFGLTKRDRMHTASLSPLRAVADELAALLSVGGFDLYIHNQPNSDLSIGLGKQPSIFVPEWGAKLSRSSLVFLLSRPFVNMRRGVHVVHRISPGELALLLAGVARGSMPGFGAELGREAELEERARALTKAIPRRSRKGVALLAEEYARNFARNPEAFNQWFKAVHQTAARAALLLADDLNASLDLVKQTTAETIEGEGTATDLLRFWVSDTAVRFRKAQGR